MTTPSTSAQEAVAGWRYSINYGPDGEENYANVYAADGQFVGNLRTYHAIAICNAFAVCDKLASPSPAGSPASPSVDVGFPMGAIENGRAFADRLEMTGLECPAGDIRMCSDWQEFRRCFDWLAQWALDHASLASDATPAATPVSEAETVAWQTVSDFVDEMLRDWPGGDDCRMGFGLNGATVTKGQFRAVQAALASLPPAATPVSEAGPDWMEAQQVRKRRGVEIMQEYAWGNLTPLGVANHLKRAGFNIDYAQKIANDLAKPASSPAPVRPIGNQGISDYQREIARNMAEGFAAWNAARQEALPSDEPASSPAGGDVATGLRAEIAHDGFTGDIIGRYVTREGKRGAVVQQDGTRVVHVYGEKWLPIETQMALSQSTSAGRVGE